MKLARPSRDRSRIDHAPIFTNRVAQQIASRPRPSRKKKNDFVNFIQTQQIKNNDHWTQLNSHGNLIRGMVKSFSQRRNLISNPLGIWNEAGDGARWVFYFALNHDLERDIKRSIKSCVVSKLNPLGFWQRKDEPPIRESMHKAFRAGLTYATTTPQDLEDFKVVSKTKGAYIAMDAANSIAAISLLSMTLTKIGETAKNGISSLLIKGAKGGLLATSIAGVLVGLSELSKAVQQSEIAPHLQPIRDQYIDTKSAEFMAYIRPFNTLRESAKE